MPAPMTTGPAPPPPPPPRTAIPPRTRDIDIWCDDAERADVITAVMGAWSWYHERDGAYVEVWGPDTFVAPTGWRERARVLTDASIPGVRLVVPHPHDVLYAKIERWESGDRDHARRILAAVPLEEVRARALADRSPYRRGSITDSRRCAAFEANFASFLASLGGG